MTLYVLLVSQSLCHVDQGYLRLNGILPDEFPGGGVPFWPLRCQKVRMWNSTAR